MLRSNKMRTVSLSSQSSFLCIWKKFVRFGYLGIYRLTNLSDSQKRFFANWTENWAWWNCSGRYRTSREHTQLNFHFISDTLFGENNTKLSSHMHCALDTYADRVSRYEGTAINISEKTKKLAQSFNYLSALIRSLWPVILYECVHAHDRISLYSLTRWISHKINQK